MKKFSKILSVALLVALVLSLGVASAFAQTEAYTGSNGDGAKISIGNAAMGETYSVVKLFDATVTGDEGGSIAYQGNIPESLSAYFTKNATTGEITATAAALDNDGNLNSTASGALKTWAEGQTALISATSNGTNPLEFTNLPYGYYVVLTTQGAGAVSVTSTNPNAEIKDKNSTTITAKKTVDGTSYSIGDTITYTGTFNTTNFMDKNGESTKIKEYVITDTLPNFLSDVTVTSIVVKKGDATTTLTTQQFDANKQITIPWVDGSGNSLYANNSQLIITYTAKLTAIVNVNGDNTNTIEIIPHDMNGQPWETHWKDSTKITTYAAALMKVDENGYPLKGAQFTIKGLVVTETSAGVYTVVSYDPTSNTQSAVLSTDDNGKLYIVGLKEGLELVVTEAKSPDGYNMLNGTVNLKPQVLTVKVEKSDGWAKYDEDGNLVEFYQSETQQATVVERNLEQLDAKALEVENNKGTQLPSTGGIGTTIFYVVGGVLVLAAIILLVTKKRMSE